MSELGLILLRIVLISKKFYIFFRCCDILYCHNFVGTMSQKNNIPYKNKYFSFSASFRWNLLKGNIIVINDSTKNLYIITGWNK